MMYKYLLGNGAQYMGRALGYFRRVAKEVDTTFVRAVAQEREFVRESLRISHIPRAPSGRAPAPPAIHQVGLANALGVMRTLSSMAQDAARVEVFGYDTCCGYLMQYNLPLPQAAVAPVAPKVAPLIGGPARRHFRPIAPQDWGIPAPYQRRPH